MPSVQYRLVSTLFRMLPVKKMLSAPVDKLMSMARKSNARKGKGFQIPKDPGFAYQDTTVSIDNKEWHCLRIRDKATGSTAFSDKDAATQANPAPSPQKALLLIYGGGMVTAADASDIQPALTLARATQREAWFPFYPLCLDYNAMVSLEMIVACYREMLKTYPADKICILGYSSGACLALALCHHIRSNATDLPQPEKLILLSPGALTDDPAWHERAKALEKKDILVGYGFLGSIQPIMEHGRPLPSWFLNPFSAPFDGFPPCHFWFGSDEILAASVPNFEEACHAAGVPYTMTVGEGMCHCYPVIPGPDFPEKREALARIAEQIGA